MDVQKLFRALVLGGAALGGGVGCGPDTNNPPGDGQTSQASVKSLPDGGTIHVDAGTSKGGGVKGW